MTDAELLVADLIRTAFQGVTLGNGVGLREGLGLDDYADSVTLARYRSQDEKDDWSRIPLSDLNDYHSSLSFFDEEGLRFHLPAFLIAELEDTLNESVLFHLCYVGHDIPSRFAILNQAQRTAVREFLWLRLADHDHGAEFERPWIEHALLEYWMTPEDE